MMRALRTMVLAGASVALLVAPVQAQFAQVVTITVNPITVADYADYMGLVNEAAMEIGDPRTVSVYRPVMGGSPFRFMLVTLFDDYAEMDSWMGGPPTILTQALGEDDAREVREEIRDVVQSVTVDVYALQPDFSSGNDLPQEGQAYLRLVTTTVEPSANAAYGNMLRAAATAGDARGIKRNRWTRVEGESFTHVATWGAETIAGLASPGPPALLNESLAPEAAEALLEAAEAAVVSRTFETWRYDPELSRGPM